VQKRAVRKDAKSMVSRWKSAWSATSVKAKSGKAKPTRAAEAPFFEHHFSRFFFFHPSFFGLFFEPFFTDLFADF